MHARPCRGGAPVWVNIVADPNRDELARRARAFADELHAFAGAIELSRLENPLPQRKPQTQEEARAWALAYNAAEWKARELFQQEYVERFSARAVSLFHEFERHGLTPSAALYDEPRAVSLREYERPTNLLSVKLIARNITALSARL